MQGVPQDTCLHHSMVAVLGTLVCHGGHLFDPACLSTIVLAFAGTVTVASGGVVTVTCVGPNFPGMFALNVTAFSADGACNATKSVVTNVTSATRPTVSVTAPAQDVNVCLVGDDTQVLDFTVDSSASASITLGGDGASFCLANTSTVSKSPSVLPPSC